ncbi:MAG TPA: hypothetical protein VLE20_02555 [Blastocatellia bacterium]|nr:hypothetical protein [Blastocatellia bacterium]
MAGIEAGRSQAPQDPRFEIESAFVLCSIGHDYENNKNRITAALRESRDDPRFDSVAAERMITRLIRRGDASLLSELFNAASWSDGALSEALSDTFGEQLVRNPKDFLLSLNVAGSARQNVLKLIGGSSLSQNEMNELKAYLTSAGVPFSLRPVAKELLANLRSK